MELCDTRFHRKYVFKTGQRHHINPTEFRNFEMHCTGADFLDVYCYNLTSTEVLAYQVLYSDLLKTLYTAEPQLLLS
jgi:hypothetical protein